MMGAALAVYFVQLAAYKPHLADGWSNILLYSSLTDWVLHYYDATVVREGPAPDPEGSYLFAVFPHGVYGTCRAFTGGTSCWKALYPGIFARWGSFGAAFYMPGIREFSLLAGCVDASKETLQNIYEKYQQNVMLLPGGIDEMGLTDGQSTDTKLVLADRKGYAKLAIEMGADIVPSYCFGNNPKYPTNPNDPNLP